MKNTAATFAAAKAKGEKLSMLTAYDYSTAKLEDESGINGILVGDSLGNVVLGYEDTVSVTMEDMIHHGAAVARGAKNALVVVDMPFMSYEVTVEEAVRNAGRLMKEGRAGAVKLEGGVRVARADSRHCEGRHSRYGSYWTYPSVNQRIWRLLRCRAKARKPPVLCSPTPRPLKRQARLRLSSRLSLRRLPR